MQQRPDDAKKARQDPGAKLDAPLKWHRPRAGRRRHSDAEVAAYLRLSEPLLDAGMTVAEAAYRIGISPSTLFRWRGAAPPRAVKQAPIDGPDLRGCRVCAVVGTPDLLVALLAPRGHQRDAAAANVPPEMADPVAAVRAVLELALHQLEAASVESGATTSEAVHAANQDLVHVLLSPHKSP